MQESSAKGGDVPDGLSPGQVSSHALRNGRLHAGHRHAGYVLSQHLWRLLAENSSWGSWSLGMGGAVWVWLLCGLLSCLSNGKAASDLAGQFGVEHCPLVVAPIQSTRSMLFGPLPIHLPILCVGLSVILCVPVLCREFQQWLP